VRRPRRTPGIASKALGAKHKTTFHGVDDAYFDVAALSYDLAFADPAEAH
jgi:hypothetical protein